MRAAYILNDLLSRVSDIGRSLMPVEDRQASLIERCETLLSRQGEATSLALGREILDRYNRLNTEDKSIFFQDMMEQFGVNEANLSAIIDAWKKHSKAATNSYPDDISAQSHSQKFVRDIHIASEPRSQELIRRLNRAPGGTQDLVSMRADLLSAMEKATELKQIDNDFRHLFNSWFNRGFLELRLINWSNTPALILEKIISYEAIHEINGWDELRLRVAAEDRRLYGFFHPALIAEPLIFVEVAITGEIPTAIAPILANNRQQLNPSEANTAVFYSISNCQKGLQGISFGNFLIKQAVEELRHEFPKLSQFVTLSPLPEMRHWVQQQVDQNKLDEIPKALHQTIQLLNQSKDAIGVDHSNLKKLTAWYLLKAKKANGSPFDYVARFHLGNGACLEQINCEADSSEIRLKSSWGIMVNYLYNLSSIEPNHEAFANHKKVICSDSINKLLK
ncbi:MAG: malonyl-CoA decarboxylase [Candidatus Azotimanducaceae bacterium]|jgi:malonyl-CoA decarboxylase